jgi:hypothetical protein
MPATQTATHPHTRQTITFTEADHSYVDDTNHRYASGTGLVAAFFPHFNPDEHAPRIAARRNTTPEAIKAEWEAHATESCDYGTHCHEYAEASIKGTPTPAPATERERHAFRAIDTALVGINRNYTILACEQIIFAQCLHLAGTMDLFARRKRDRMLAVLDWKTNKAIDLTAKFGGTGHKPIQHIGDCNGNHYRLQFATYGQVMRIGQYLALDEPLDNGVIWLPPMSAEPQWIRMQDAKAEADAMIRCWERGYFGQGLAADEYLRRVRERRAA